MELTEFEFDFEKWRPVVGFEDHFEVSEFGRVRQIGAKNVRTTHLSAGYPHVHLTADGWTRKVMVHTLVLEAFRGQKPSPDHTCRHLNDVKTDNRLDNLVWGTAAENVADAIRNGCRALHPWHKETSPVFEAFVKVMDAMAAMTEAGMPLSIAFRGAGDPA